jgi:hypothetical protein
MKSLLTLWSKLACEIASRCCTSADRDIKTVSARAEHEGLSFLAITLADFGKDFERSLDRGHVAPTAFSSWRKRGGLPLFLRGFLEHVFDPASGVLFEDPSKDCILGVRQLTLLFSKAEVPCSYERDQAAFDQYLECETEVRSADAQRDPIDLEDFHRVSSMLFASLLTRIDSDVYHGRVKPRHGPGSTADRLVGNQKWNNRYWPERLNQVFPAWEFLIPNHRFSDVLDEVDFREPGTELPARVITVPKTLKGPRIIAMEPTSLQFMQGGLQQLFYDYVEQNPVLRDMIGFLDQTPNQRLARQGSLLGDLATLDLSEASDRVSMQLVDTMLSNHPHLQRAVQATRSLRASVPGKSPTDSSRRTVELAKFASMGSALCFPIEAMVFLTVIFIGIERELSTPFCDRNQLNRFRHKVRVFGDDIIIPVDFVQSVVLSLETFGFKVNENKSFWTGRFRESCGREYFDGFDVSIVKVRDIFPARRSDVQRVISLVSLRNQLWKEGYESTVEWLDSRIRKLIPEFPVVPESCSLLGRHDYAGFDRHSVDPNLQVPLVRGYGVRAPIPINSLDGVGALSKWFLKKSSLPAAEDHLERSGRPVVVNIKLRNARLEN